MVGDPHDALHAPTPIVDFEADKSSTFHGAIIGNLTGTASKATADAQGRNIVNTYALKTDLSNVDKKFANYAPKANPTFTGTVTIPTPATSDNSTKAATTAFVKAQGYATTTTLNNTVKNYLPLTGGTLTGALTVPSTLSVKAEGAEGGQIALLHGSDNTQGINIDTTGGALRIFGNPTAGKIFSINPQNGQATFDGKHLVRSVNGTTADANGNVTIQAGGSVPVGTIIAYGGVSAPEGYLICNGGAISRTQYSALYGVIGTRFGAGDGSSTFNIPNMHHRFLEGTTTAGEVGNYVSAGLPNIEGTLPFRGEGDSGFWCNGAWGCIFPASQSVYNQLSGKSGDGYALYDSIGINATNSSNIYKKIYTVQPESYRVYYLIKY